MVVDEEIQKGANFMAGLSCLRNGPALGCAGVVQKRQGSVCCPKTGRVLKDDSVLVGDDQYEVKLFDQVLEVFLSRARKRGCFRPIPVLLGKEQQPLDLFKLFLVVSNIGGFNLVKGFWKLVAKELGFDSRLSGAIKLIYFKYLYELDGWFGGFCRDGRVRNGGCHCGGDCAILPFELEIKFRSLIKSASFGCKWQSQTLVRHKRKDTKINEPAGKSKLSLLDVENVQKLCNYVGSICGEDDERLGDNSDLLTLQVKSAKKELKSRKRKRESLSRMLDWVCQIAKCPEHPSIGEIPPPSKWENNGGVDLWIQVIRARDALLQRIPLKSNTESTPLQSKKKICLSISKDVGLLGDLHGEKSRSGEQPSSLAKPRLCSCCSPSSPLRCKLIHPLKTENGIKGRAFMTDDLSTANASLTSSKDDLSHRHVAIGPRFQAVVPAWSGTVSKSETKWLGTRIWPLESGDNNSLVDTDTIGKGKPEQCSCWLPGSIECTRFHIAEGRMKLKIELGLVFFHWRFDQMGEEVSLRWTTEEEKRFKDMVRLNPPSLERCFWDYTHQYLPQKTRAELVSYYFNVFLNCRRRYQNRVSPNDIDSDDDERAFGSVGDIYGHEAIKVPGEDVMICSENKLCMDLT